MPNDSAAAGSRENTAQRRIAELRRRLAALQERARSGAYKAGDVSWPRNLNDDQGEQDPPGREAYRE